MSWVKLDDRALDDPRFLALPRTARLLHVEALSYTLSHDGSGFIPTAALPRLTDDEHPTASVAALADAGLWEVVAGGWRVVWLLDDQMSPDEIARRRAFNRTRQERLRRHRSNDHSTCDPARCGALASNASRNASRNALQASAEREGGSGVTRYSSYPDQTRPEGRGGGGSGPGSAASAGAAAAPPGRRRGPMSDEAKAKMRASRMATEERRQAEAEARADERRREAEAYRERQAEAQRQRDEEWLALGGNPNAVPVSANTLFRKKHPGRKPLR